MISNKHLAISLAICLGLGLPIAYFASQVLLQANTSLSASPTAFPSTTPTLPTTQTPTSSPTSLASLAPTPTSPTSTPILNPTATPSPVSNPSTTPYPTLRHYTPNPTQTVTTPTPTSTPKPSPTPSPTPIPSPTAAPYGITFGGTGREEGSSVIQTWDGGFAIAGSYGDMLLIKTDANGHQQWNRTYGGNEHEKANSLVQTIDGGYALVGTTDSFGNQGSPSGQVAYLVKTNSDGIMEWNKTYMIGIIDAPNHIIQTIDGGYAVASIAGSWSFGSGVVFKTDENGTMQWRNAYSPIVGGVIQTSDGSYVVVGTDLNYTGQPKYVYLCRTDSEGKLLWGRQFGQGAEQGKKVLQTHDGGYAVAAYAGSFGSGGGDIWLIKTDSNGNMVWNKTYGGPQSEDVRSFIETSDGGFVLVGSTYSYGAGEDDIFLIKTDAYGNVQWNQTFGGPSYETGWGVVQTTDGGYAVVGDTFSFGKGSADIWLFFVDPTGQPK